ncbi:helix-turn-helix protein [Melghirimyces profundicolus]|uniref:Helix-turn-helix protein n=1 Tax=Melghirimyces profundicolus TaxID=1242148 RepID=A0A2T6BQW3_9BACL|nr:helix-turn-helix domain-containing protein [Melghirimyces profundicolus]PTX58434.1 helix-turn-helix protein [Melghirimyces profundicolus]
MEDIKTTHRVEDPEQAAALLHPLRGDILYHLREPASASQVAREIGETPQRVNYHLKALEKANLVRRAGTRQVKNLVEVLYQAIARSFLLADTLGFSPGTVQKLKDQSALAHLIQTADRIRADAVDLMERSDEAETLPSATLETNIILASESEREAFVEDYVRLVEELASRYQACTSHGRPYQLMLAVYPRTAKEGFDE